MINLIRSIIGPKNTNIHDLLGDTLSPTVVTNKGFKIQLKNNAATFG